MERDDPSKRRAERWLVDGRVQGVGFRWYVRQAASELSVAGDVRNLSDGRVEIRAAGTPDQLDRLLTRVRTGPPGSRVQDVECADVEGGYGPHGFQIRH